MERSSINSDMKEELKLLKQELDKLLNTEALTSDNVLELSKKIDKVIIRFYKV